MSTCAHPECYRATRNGIHCPAHEKRLQRGASMTAPVVVRSSPWETLTESAIRYADADVEDDREFGRATDVLRKAAQSYGQSSVRKAIAEGRKQARARGVRFGRPPKVSVDQAQQAVQQHGGVRAAAKVLGMHRRNLQRILKSKAGGQ